MSGKRFKKKRAARYWYELWTSSSSATLFQACPTDDFIRKDTMSEPGALLVLKFRARSWRRAKRVKSRICWGKFSEETYKRYTEGVSSSG